MVFAPPPPSIANSRGPMMIASATNGCPTKLPMKFGLAARCSAGVVAPPSWFLPLSEMDYPVGTLGSCEVGQRTSCHETSNIRWLDNRNVFSARSADPPHKVHDDWEDDDDDELSIGSIDIADIVNTPWGQPPSFLTGTDDRNSWAYHPVTREVFL
jgi:hypothetical protein